MNENLQAQIEFLQAKPIQIVINIQIDSNAAHGGADVLEQKLNTLTKFLRENNLISYIVND